MIRGSKARESWLRSYRGQLLSWYFDSIQAGDADKASRLSAKIEVLDYIADMVFGIDLRPHEGVEEEIL